MASATEYSLKYINLYPKTEKELRAKLMEKHYGEEEIEKTITYLKRKNYVNDELYCELYINSQLIKKGKPLYAVKQKLLQKWVDKTLVNKSLAQYKDEIDDWVSQTIEKLIQQRKKKGLEWFEIIQKLMMRGYSLELIKKVLNKREE